jgi:hypothetical protein
LVWCSIVIILPAAWCRVTAAVLRCANTLFIVVACPPPVFGCDGCRTTRQPSSHLLYSPQESAGTDDFRLQTSGGSEPGGND